MVVIFILGVIMSIFGLTLLVKGETRLGRFRLSSVAARSLGLFLLAFFPIILTVRRLVERHDAEEHLDAMGIHITLTGLWVLLATVWFFRARQRVPRERHTPASQDEEDVPRKKSYRGSR